MTIDDRISRQAAALQESRSRSGLQRLVHAIAAGVEVSITESGRPFASIDPAHRDRVCALDSVEFRSFVSSTAFEHNIAFTPNMFGTIVAFLERRSKGAPRRPVFHRFGFLGENMYIDRCTNCESIVEISPSNGVRLLDTAPILFARTEAMLELPLPDLAGSLNDIDSLVPQLDAKSLKLFKASLIAATHRTGPYFLTCLVGPHGAGKTNLARLYRSLIDPCAEPLRCLPRKSDDLWVQVSNEYMACFDNVTHIPLWLSNELCQILCGGAKTVRQLYSNTLQVTLSANGAVVMTGIRLPVSQPDLLNRSIVVYVLTMPDEQRLPEEEWQKAFTDAYPRLFGGLCNAILAVLRNLGRVQVPGSIRMLDAARWVAAAESSLGWSPGEFARLYTENQRDVMLGVLDEDEFGSAVLEFARDNPHFEGNATEFEQRMAPYRLRATLDWPRLKQIRHRLNELQPLLRERGVLVSSDLRGGPNNQKLISIKYSPRTQFVVKPRPRPSQHGAVHAPAFRRPPKS